MPSIGAAPMTLHELLTERDNAARVSDEWATRAADQQRRQEILAELHTATGLKDLAAALGSARAAEALRHLARNRREAFYDNDPDLARQVVAWSSQHRRDPQAGRTLAGPLTAVLQAHHDLVWRHQVTEVLTATDAHALDERGLYRVIKTLQAGHLVSDFELKAIHEPIERLSRTEFQAYRLHGYEERRDAAAQQWRASSGGWPADGPTASSSRPTTTTSTSSCAPAAA